MTRLRVEPLLSGPVERQATGRLLVETGRPGFTDLTPALQDFVSGSRISHGVATILCRHTSASLVIQENADPDVRVDLAAALTRLAPRHAGYLHHSEGPDDMPAHIRTILTAATLSIPVLEKLLALGTWQAVYLVEHRDRPHTRELLINLTGN